MLIHPKGRNARVLLTSVFGPYAQDDAFGSRAINPMELYHNQVTRAQGAFSLRMFHRSWGIMMIQANLSAPSTVLDFPKREDFIRELRENQYDIVGISSIIVNIGKVQEMCRLVREISPRSTLIVGGHVAGIPGVEHLLDADHIVKGDGISWMRSFLGEDPEAPVVHPSIVSGFNLRVLGIQAPTNETAATIIPSVGCPMGCNFCTTSAFFGGKGKWKHFYETGDELFEIMRTAETNLRARSFFVMDENFLLNRTRALQLLSRMKQENKAWSLYLFSSANAIKKYTMQELVELGVSWLWLGLESPNSQYSKLNNSDTLELSTELRQHGIKLLGSTIIGLEHHTPDNIAGEVEHAVAHETDFHQFMLYTPVPGTPLYFQIKEEGRLRDVNLADIHGQFQFNFEHPAITAQQSQKFLDWAFWRDFERNGPSLFRICRTTFEGWMRYRNYPDVRVRNRFQWEARALSNVYSAALWAMEKRLKISNVAASQSIRKLRDDMHHEFGAMSKAWARLLGPILLWTSGREEKRLAEGRTYEPPTFIERKNWITA